MANRAEKKIAKKVSLSNEYIKYFNTRKSRNKGVIPKDTLTKAQWERATPTERELAKAGIRYKRSK